MRRRRLGNTDITVSELAFGAWGIGGRTAGPTSYGDADDQVSLRALSSAVANGITFFDTSNVYGDGHSEELLGLAFRSCRASVVIATKVGWPSYAGPADFSPAGMRKSLEGSLRRLQSDYVDVLQLHNPPLDWLQTQPDILTALQNFVAEGKVRALGVSVRSPEEAAPLIGCDALAAIQANFNMMDTRILSSGVLQDLKKRGQSLVVRTPLCFGFLSGLINSETVFVEGDHRAAWPAQQREVWVDGARIFSEISDRYGVGPLVEGALRFCLSFDGVAAILSGMMNEVEVVKNVAAVNKGPLPQNVVEEVLEVHSRAKFFVARSPAQQSKNSLLSKV